MTSNKIMLLVAWIVFTACIMAAYSLSKGEVRGTSWKLRLSFSAFMSLFITTILFSAIFDISSP